MAAICPRCSESIDQPSMQHLPARDSASDEHAHTIAFCCGRCDAILGVQLDSATVGRPP